MNKLIYLIGNNITIDLIIIIYIIILLYIITFYLYNNTFIYNYFNLKKK